MLWILNRSRILLGGDRIIAVEHDHAATHKHVKDETKRRFRSQLQIAINARVLWPMTAEGIRELDIPSHQHAMR